MLQSIFFRFHFSVSSTFRVAGAGFLLSFIFLLMVSTLSECSVFLIVRIFILCHSTHKIVMYVQMFKSYFINSHLAYAKCHAGSDIGEDNGNKPRQQSQRYYC